MIKKLQHIFALSEKGAKDLVKAVIWCFVCNLALMFPIGAVLFTIQHLLGCLEGGGSPTDGFWLYVGFALAVLVLLFVLHWFQYASLYIATYRESANRRVSLAETLRRLPLSFFGNRDLSDLTSTMIADCSSLDQMFSHYVPQLFASVGSTLVIGVCMFACDWRMALAVLWVVPVAVALTAGSKKIQDAFGTKNILNKRAVADCIQEGLETIRDIKACHRQERYLGDLEAKLGYYGALLTLDLRDGAMFDIGGGSTEIVEVREGKILRAQSLPLGSLNLFRSCVSKIWPKSRELDAMRETVERTLTAANLPLEKTTRVCGVGGTARAVLKIANAWYGRPELERRMTPKELHQLTKALQKQDERVRQMVLNNCPDRIHTILPGALLMDAVSQALCRKELYISRTGVREGYLYHRILREYRN